MICVFLEQLHKEAEIFILKNKKRRFTTEDMNRFMRDLELRQDLDELDAKKMQNISMFSKATIEDKINSEYVSLSTPS